MKYKHMQILRRSFFFPPQNKGGERELSKNLDKSLSVRLTFFFLLPYEKLLRF